jgi:phage nucleotide-binding protein
MSIADKISPVKALPKILAMLVYGRSGTGKTTFGGTFPKPALLLDIREKGTDSVSNIEGLDVIQIDTFSELEEVYWYLLSDEGKKYKSVIIDQISQLQDLIMDHVMREEGKDVMSQRLWGNVSGLMKTWLFNYRDLIDVSINVLFIAHDRTTDVDSDSSEDQIDPSVGPRLMPSVAGTLNGAVKVIGSTFIREVFSDDGARGVEYGMRTGPHAYYTTKLRVPTGTVVPEWIGNPSYDKIMALMSGETKAIRRKRSEGDEPVAEPTPVETPKPAEEVKTKATEVKSPVRRKHNETSDQQ